MSLSAHVDLTVLCPRRILVRGVNWLGDAVMTTPALTRLRDRFPEAHITILTAEKLKDLWLNHPAVNEITTFAPDENLFSVSRRLRNGNYNVALALPNSPRSALEIWLARVPIRIGNARGWANFFLTNPVPRHSVAATMRKRSVAEIMKLVASNDSTPQVISTTESNAASHQIHDYLRLVSELGAKTMLQPPTLVVTSSEIESVRRKFQIPETSRPIFGMNPGAEYGPAKRWPVQRFIAAAREIQARTNCTWLILGAKTDASLAGEIVAAIQSQTGIILNLAGKTSLRELCAVLKLCRVILTNDTGPMHVAAALGTPVVVPFGSTSPELTGPNFFGDSGHVLLRSTAACSPCFRRNCPIDFRCMKSITVETVVAAVLKAEKI